MLKNTTSSYGTISKLLHWVIGIMLIALIVVGFTMTSMEPSEDKWQLYFIHKSTGVILLGLILLRFIWRMINISVALPKNLPSWQKLISHTAHYVLYIFMFLMPASGILMSYFGGHPISVFNFFTISPTEKNLSLAKFFHDLHGITAWLFVGLIILHICGGLYHHFILKDEVLTRMTK